MIKLEICASSVESVLQAAKGGASRVELCDNLSEGGTTPPLSWIEKSIELTDIQIFTLIRPRAGDFLYTDNEYLIMKRDIVHCGGAGCHGVVLGLLTEEGKVDKKRTAELIKLAKSYQMSVTFHRAIDRTVDIFEALEDVIELGFDRILTSGGKLTAIEGKEILKKMIEQADGRIIVMPGSGINEKNIVDLYKYLNVNEFHGSFRTLQHSRMLYRSKVFADDDSTMVSSALKIKEALDNIDKLR